MHEESLFVSKIPQLPHEAWTRQGGCLSEGKLVTGQVLGTVELKRGLLLLKQLVWIPVCQVSHTNQVRLKPPTQESDRARLKKPFYRETWADFHDMKSFQTGIMIFTWTQWHVFCSGIFYSLVAGSKPDLLRPCFEGGNDGNMFVWEENGGSASLPSQQEDSKTLPEEMWTRNRKRLCKS